eukprot:scaffold40738_cov69-Phaeocystis_antarctica.AAC.1
MNPCARLKALFVCEQKVDRAVAIDVGQSDVGRGEADGAEAERDLPTRDSHAGAEPYGDVLTIRRGWRGR